MQTGIYTPPPQWAPRGTDDIAQVDVVKWALTAEPADVAMNILEARHEHAASEETLARLRLMVEDFGRGIRDADELAALAADPF